jgi:hypothetical protein
LDFISQIRLSLPKSRRSLRSLACLLLAVTVVAWGTAYKLSLYKSGQHDTPAKVCTRGSDAAKSGLDQAADGRKLKQASVALICLSVVYASHFPPIVNSDHAKAADDFAPLRSTPILHLRPPPAELLTLA